MAFVLRRPFALSFTLRTIRQTSQPALRTLHTINKPSLTSQLSASRHAFRSLKTKPSTRFYTNPSIPTQTGTLTQRLLYGGAIVAAGAIAANLVFNRETREDGGMPPFERAYLNETFMHTGLGIGMIGVAARALHTSGWSLRVMSMNPWVAIGGGLALSIGSMIVTRSIDPDK